MRSTGEVGRRFVAAALIAAAAAVAVPGATAVAADPGKVVKGTYGTGASAYPYLVYVPKSYRPARKAPLVVFAHGCQTTAEQQLKASLYDPVAEKAGAIVLYPDVTAGHAAQPGPLRNCWKFFDPASQHRGSGDAAAIAGMTHAVMDRWKVDARRVYMVGMSAGGFMASIMAAAYPELFAAVHINAAGAYADTTCLLGNPATLPASVSASMARTEMGSRARVVPRLVTGGDADQGITPPCADKALEQGLRTNNLAVGSSQTKPISLTPTATREVAAAKAGAYGSTVRSYANASGCVVGQRWSIHGMNHFWPGGSSATEWKNFTDPKGPSGAQISWDFLKRFTKGSGLRGRTCR